jgi:GTPase
LNQRIVELALSSIGDVDVVLLIADANKPYHDSDKILVNTLSDTNKPVILAINKIDRQKSLNIAPIIEQWSSVYPFEAIVPISAKLGLGIEKLLDALLYLLPSGPPFFSEDTLTDMPMKFIVSEIIREKVFRLTGEEIPYSIAVTVEKYEEKNNLSVIHAVIHVEKNSQKGIIIGKQGQMLKKIGQDSRKDIEKLLDHPIFLNLFVRVQKNWSKDTKALRKFGY